MRNYRLKALAATGLVFGVLVVAGGAAFLATAGLVASPNGPTVRIESGQLLEGGTEVTRLSAVDVGSPGVCGFTIDVVFDPLVKDATDCVDDPENNFDLAVCNPDHPDDNKVVVTGGSASGGPTGDIPLADITWTAVGSAGDSTVLDVQIVSFVDCSTPPVEIPGVADQDGVNVIVAPSPSPSPTPSPSPAPPPSPTPTLTVTPTATTTPTSTTTPTATPSATATPTPPPGPTRTLHWGPGWHNATWSGASTPEEVFACAAGNYAAAYRLVGGGWERHFPDRPDISNMGSLEQYAAFLILITEEVTCEMPVADAPGTERTLDWGVGWQNEGWTDPDGTPPQNAFACAAGNYAAAYRLVSGGWERYFPDRPELSNMGLLNRYDAFLILVTAPVSCTMPIAPGGAASESPFIGAWESTDFDGSHQTLAIGGGGGGVYHVTLFDDKATFGCPETQGSATAMGSGSIEGDNLHVEGSVLCPSEGETYPWEVDFTYDSSDDTLAGPLGPHSVQWNRMGQ